MTANTNASLSFALCWFMRSDLWRWVSEIRVEKNLLLWIQSLALAPSRVAERTCVWLALGLSECPEQVCKPTKITVNACQQVMSLTSSCSRILSLQTTRPMWCALIPCITFWQCIYRKGKSSMVVQFQIAYCCIIQITKK